MPFPAISGALPWMGSKSAYRSPVFALGQRPSPPATAAASSLRISPKRLVVTITSYFSGRRMRSYAMASTSISLYVMPFLFATPVQTSLKKESDFNTLALCTIVIFFLRVFARVQARSAILSQPFRVKTLVVYAPSSWSSSTPEYMPSVFSLTITKSNFLAHGNFTVFSGENGRMLAYRSSSFRKRTSTLL
ncbi:Uncharacterised protein [uncultured archaeon]|nr:Uncharacterised protein [uncultured archaeon]